MSAASFVIGISGGTGAGKSAAARMLQGLILPTRSLIISTDSYYRDLRDISADRIINYNFDRTEALDMDLLRDHLGKLKRGESVLIPDYDFVSHRRRGDGTRVSAPPVIIVEGLFILTDGALRRQLDLTVFIDTPADLRLIRRLERDTVERGRTADEVSERYMRDCRPMHERYVEPGKELADLIVSGESITEESLRPVLERIPTYEDL